MYDRTFIANLALGHIGDRVISDIDDTNSSDAEVLRSNYDHAVKATFSGNDWLWAQREAQLQLLPAVPTTRYAYFYQLPPYFARFSLLCESADMRDPLDERDGSWKIIEGKLATNALTVFTHYVATNWTEAQWVPHFAEAVALRLAALSCQRITHNGQKAADLRKAAKDALVEGRVTDGQFQPVRGTFVKSRWARDRFARGMRSVRPDIT